MAQCLTPYQVRPKLDPNGATIPVPCGKCPECLSRRASGWSFRLMQENKHALASHFITLTYDTKTVPISSNGFMSLRKSDVQLFIKRLRKAHPTGNGHSFIKYYLVGEYGGKTLRPHYHLLLFNADITLISPAWNLGAVHYGTVSGASVGYTLKYMCKPRIIPIHRNDDRLREFSLMSKGLGTSYMTPAMIAWHKASLLDRMYCTTEDQKKITMPRYYKNKIYHEHERDRIAFFAKQTIIKKQLETIAKYGPNYYRDKFQSDAQAFTKMFLHSEKGRDKI